MNLNQTIIINPPITIPSFYIDSPAFVFYQSLIAYNTLKAKYTGLQYIDFFIKSELKHTNTYYSINNKYTYNIDIFYNSNVENMIVHYSSYLRAEGLYNSQFDIFLNFLSKLCPNAKIYLADFFTGTTHYLPYDKNKLLEIYPCIEDIFTYKFPYSNFIPETMLLQNIDPVPYLEFLQEAKYNNLIKDYFEGEVVFPYVLSLGCPYNCSFCQDIGEKWQGGNIDIITNDLLNLKKNGIDRIYIMDSYANFNLDFFKSILLFCIQHNIKLHFTNGVGLKHLNEEIIFLLSKVVKIIYISPESLLEDSLKEMRKPFLFSDIIDVLVLLKKYNIPIYCHFVIHTPKETKEDIIHFFNQLKKIIIEFKIIPCIQLYNTKSNLFVNKNKCINKYKSFSLEYLK